MKTTKQTRLFTAWIALLLVFSFLTFPVTALDLTTTDYESDYEESPEPAISNDAIVRPNNEQTANTSAIVTASTLADGVYAFRNIGNGSFWIDTQYNSTVPGYHLQQYIFNGSTPIDSFSRSCLFKITKVAGSGVGARYVVRSMLNNLMSFGFSGNDVMTKTIPANDADVAIEDTFYISYTASGYMIRPYGQSYIVAANDTDAYGASGAPDSYLINTAVGAAGSQGKWEIHQYIGSAQHGYAISGLDTGLTEGKTQTVSINTWSTVIGANTATFTVDSGYTSYLTVSSLSPTYRSRFQLTPSKIGFVQLHLYINNAAGTAVSSSAQPYIIGPDIPLGEAMYIQSAIQPNLTPLKIVDIEGPSTADSAAIQINAFSRDSHKKWIFERIDRGYYRIKSAYSGKYIGVDSSNGTSIRQYSTDANYTHWYFEKTTNGNYKIICKASSSKALLIPENSYSAETNLTYGTFVQNTTLNDEWKLISSIYTIQNYYDVSFQNNATYVQAISDANTYLIEAFKNYFNIDMEYAGSSYWEELSTNACDVQQYLCDNYCNTDCSFHHKNVDHIYAQMVNLPRNHNEMLITWMDRLPRHYCQEINNVHQAYSSGLAITKRNLPYIRMLTLTSIMSDTVGSGQPDSARYLAPMVMISIHEMTHCFNMPDIYGSANHGSGVYNCTMGYYDENAFRDMFCNYFIFQEDDSSIFCESCIDTILAYSIENPFKMNNYLSN